MKSGHRKAILYLGSSIAAVACAFNAAAEEQTASTPDRGSALEEIVVTARRRDENLQTTPVAITAITSQTLEARRVVTLVDVARLAPNVQIQEIGSILGTAGVAIRGINYGDNVVGQDAPVGIYLDGVAAGRNSVAVMDLVEPDSVQVLRGPQGTLFGRNTTAGALLITTHTPTDEFSGSVKGSYATYKEKAFQARVDTGLLGGSGIKASFAYNHRQNDGIVDNLQQPSNLDPGARTTDAYWFKVVGDWDRFSAVLTGDYSDLIGIPRAQKIVDATAATRTFVANSPLFGGSTATISQGPQLTRQNYGVHHPTHVWNQGLGLTLEYRLSDNLTVKSISGLRAYKRDDPSSLEPGNLRGPLATGGIGVWDRGLISFDLRQQSARQKSQEVQLLGDFGDVNFVLGAYYFKEDAWEAAITRLPFVVANGAAAVDVRSPRNYSVMSKSRAGFLQVDWRPSALDRKLELSGGIRYTKDARTFNQTIALIRSVDLNTENTSYLASASYQWTDGLMTYAKYSTGYRAGGFNVRSNPPIDPVYQPEKIKSWEAGFKLDALQRRLRLNGAAFYNNYRNLQTGFFVPPGAGDAGGSRTLNANARFKGVELEVVAVPTENLTLTAMFGYVDAKFKSYPTGLDAGRVLAGCTPILSGAAVVAQDCAGIADYTASPRTTADFSATYNFTPSSYGEWSVSVDYNWRGSIYWNAINTSATPFKEASKTGSYGLLGARIALSDIPLSGRARGQISLFGRNLTDEKYGIQGVDVGFFAQKDYGNRRTIGVEGKVNF